MKIGIIGLGKLGLPVSVAIGNKKHDVVGYDINPNITSDKKVKDLLFTHEKDEYGKGSLNLSTSNLKIVDSMEEVILHGDIIFLAIQTPHQKKYEGHVPIPDERADFDYTYLINCVRDLSKEMDRLGVKKIVTIISTVLPGTLRQYILPILSPNISLCYNPFFIAMGTVVYDFYNPEFILLGRVDEEAEIKVKEFYKTITDATVFTTSLENAELIKVSYNTFITTKLVMVNNLMEMCHYLPNTDIDEVTDALKLGTRRLLSPAYLTGGMGDGGGCHPRDNIAMSWLNKKLGIEYNYYDFIMKKREKQTEFLANIIIEKHKELGLPVCILGYAFKPDTNLVDGSPAILLKNLLKEHIKSIELYDPHIDLDINFKLGNKIYFIGCKHNVFKYYKFPEGSFIIDPNRYLHEHTKNILYIGKSE